MDLENIIWNKSTYKKFINYLLEIRDLKYKDFNKKLIFTKYEMIGIKLPILRGIALKIKKGDYQSFLNIPNNYYEIVMIKGFIISFIDNLEEFNNYFRDYIELIDNWAICDSFSHLKIVKKNKEYFKNIIDELINKREEYKVRLGLVLILNFYIEEEYLDYIFKVINKTNSNLYYINMARAWVLCECFIKYQDQTLEYLENNKLDKFTTNKTISKIRDSFRVNKEMKDYLLKFRR